MKRNVITIFLFPMLVIMLVISPLFLFRIGGIRANRIGHMALDLEVCACINNKQKKLFPIHINMFYVITPISNEYLFSLWSEKVQILPRILLEPLDIVIKKFKLFQRFNYFSFVSVYGHSDLSILDKFSPKLFIPDDHIEIGENLLKKLGIATGQKYVCLAVRDGQYLKDFLPEKDWSYHDFRDSNIQDYLQMAEYLTTKGLIVIRMGKAVQQKFKTNNPMIIDYAKSSLRSDFADVYLFANCYFCISTSTGMDALASIFRKPIGLVNVVNINSVAKGEIIKLFQPKSFFDKTLRRNLSLNEITKRSLFSVSESSQLSISNIELKNNSPEELKSFARDFLDIISGDGINPLKNGGSSNVLVSPEFFQDRIAKVSQSWLGQHDEYFNQNS
jgi:putative glycosyltransferase (TIGR04372 family)